MRQVVFLPDGVGGYVVEVPSLPGCRAKGKNLTAAVKDVRQVIYSHIANLQALGQTVPESTVMDIPKAEGVITYNLLLKEDVLKVIGNVFPDTDPQAILDIVSEYGKQPFENDIERIQIAAVQLSEGDIDKLVQIIIDAKRDYRDVLVWYSTKFGKYP